MTNAAKDSVATDTDPARLRKEVDDLIDTAVFLCRYWRQNGSIPTVPLRCLEDCAERCLAARSGKTIR